MKSYIEFPALGIKLFVDNIAFYIGSKPIYWYGIIIALAIMIASFVTIRLGQKNQVSPDTVMDIVVWGLPSAVVCARAYYVIFRFDYYRNNLVEIFKIWNGGIAIYGAIIGAMLSTLIYCKIKKISVLKVFDVGSLGLITGQIIGRWGNFFNQEAFGTNTTLPWGMTGSDISFALKIMQNKGLNVSPELPVHPTFLYESLWNLCVLAILVTIFLKYRDYDGKVFWSYITFYGLGRLWIEGLRTDSLYIGVIRVSQLVALACIVIGAVMLIKCRKKQQKN